jgi:tetratricopeptide (TPR) repeat protein
MVETNHRQGLMAERREARWPGAVRLAARPLAAGLLAALLIAGCAPLPVQDMPRPDAREPAPVARPGLPQGTPPAPPERRDPPATPLPAPVPLPVPPAEMQPMPGYHPASEALVEQARREALLGEEARAGATLERALRIDADNPWIWIELGHLRLQAGHAAAAESMARKALSLSARDPTAREAGQRLLQQAGSGR